jgi:ferredoxin
VDHVVKKLWIDYDRCSGQGRCFELAPDLITDDDEGFGQVLVPLIDGAQLDAATKAFNSCPERAVHLDEVS